MVYKKVAGKYSVSTFSFYCKKIDSGESNIISKLYEICSKTWSGVLTHIKF